MQELPALCSFLSTLTNGPEKTGNQSLTSKNRDLKMFREKKENKQADDYAPTIRSEKCIVPNQELHWNVKNGRRKAG